jgi:hypothetical protein
LLPLLKGHRFWHTIRGLGDNATLRLAMPEVVGIVDEVSDSDEFGLLGSLFATRRPTEGSSLVTRRMTEPPEVDE